VRLGFCVAAEALPRRVSGWRGRAARAPCWQSHLLL